MFLDPSDKKNKKIIIILIMLVLICIIFTTSSFFVIYCFKMSCAIYFASFGGKNHSDEVEVSKTDVYIH